MDLIGMTPDQIDKLQTKMLQHPKNELRSSALGRYRIIHTTLRAIRQRLGRTGSEKFDAAMQDRRGCYLLVQRGIDKWLAGRLALDMLLGNLAQEWPACRSPTAKARMPVCLSRRSRQCWPRWAAGMRRASRRLRC